MMPVIDRVAKEPSVSSLDPLVSFSDVYKSYGASHPILAGIQLQAMPGEFISLIGPSGCGKSTILKLAAGLTKATQGSISVAGLAPEVARSVTSFVFQDPTLLPWRTAQRNVELTLELDAVDRKQRRERAQELLALVGLEKAAQLYPRQLSGGMKMRVSIARALARSPRLLLMDEPFGALDEMTRNRLNEELLRLRQLQKWVALFVTHSVAEAVFLSTRILIMKANPGQIAREIIVDLPEERAAALREDRHYLDLTAKVSAALHEVHA